MYEVYVLWTSGQNHIDELQGCFDDMGKAIKLQIKLARKGFITVIRESEGKI